MSADDARFMALALTLGRRSLGRTWPNPAVGAVIVKNGAIVGRGWTQPSGRPHAETEALRRAGEAARGATLYVTLEPCAHFGKTPPCCDAIIAAGIARVVASVEDPNPQVARQGFAKLRANGIALDLGQGAEEARRTHAGHIRRELAGRPHVTLKLAISDDGKAGLPRRQPVSLTGELARDRVHLLRAMNDAILIGIGTALSDNPLLTCRLPGLEKHSPVRVVLDRDLRLRPDSRLANAAHETPLWVLAGLAASKEAEEGLKHRGAKVVRLPAHDDGIDLQAALRWLAEQGITRLLVEGGPIIAAAFLQADLIDEAWLLRAPLALGPGAIDALESLPLDALTKSTVLKSYRQETVTPDTIEYFERG